MVLAGNSGGECPLVELGGNASVATGTIFTLIDCNGACGGGEHGSNSRGKPKLAGTFTRVERAGAAGLLARGNDCA
jgi:hypothetical protein